MSSTYQKFTSLLLLIIFFVMSIHVYSPNSSWIAHEINHDNELHSDLSHHHSEQTLQLSENGSPEPEQLTKVEHNLFHAFGHLELVISSFFIVLKKDETQMLLLRKDPLAVLKVNFESPFRPPRILHLV